MAPQTVRAPRLKSYAGDPLAEAINRSGWDFLHFALVIYALWLLNEGVSVVVYAIFWPDDLSALVKFSSSFTAILWILLIPYLLSRFYYWISKAPGNLMEELLDSDVFRELPKGETQKLERRTADYERLFAHRVWPLASVLLAVIFTATYGVILAIPTIPLSRLEGAHTWEYLAVLGPVYVLAWYMLLMIIFRVGVTIICMRNLFRETPIRLSPWHPDRCGGLRPLSQYAVGVTYIIASVGFGLSLLIIEAEQAKSLLGNYWLFFWIPVYVVGSPLCFFFTLGSAHERMRAEKERQLSTISQQFNKEYRSIHESLKDTGAEALEKRVERVEYLQRLYKLTETFPVWPFDATSIRRFSSAVIGLPILPVFVSALIQLVQSRFG